MTRIAFITVNFNNAQLTAGFLESLLPQCDQGAAVVVVDNASAPHDIAHLDAVVRAWPHCALIKNLENGGFAAGCNIGIRTALADGADWVVLINNDTTVASDFVARLREQLTDKPALMSIPLREGGHTAYAGIVQWLRPMLRHFYDRLQLTTYNLQLYAIGAGLTIHRGVFEHIGLLDERYFLYFEDADFSVRARRAGIPIRFLDEPVITHGVSESTKKLGHPLLVRYHARNALRFNWRNGPWYVRMAVPFAVCYGTALQLIKLLFRKHVPESRATLAGIMDFVFGRWGRIDARTCIGIECEQIEGQTWGIGHIVACLLKELSQRAELKDKFEFHLFFKSKIPDEPWLKNPIFRCEVIRQPFPHKSFVLYYYVFLPIRLWFSKLDAMFYTNYMLPIIHQPWLPSLVLMTDDVWHEMRSPQQKPHHRLAYWVFGYWAVWFATKILAISKSSKNELIKSFGVVPERIEVAHLGTKQVHDKQSSHTIARTLGARPARERDAAPVPIAEQSRILDEIGTGADSCAESWYGAKLGDYILYVAQAFPRRHLRETIQAFEKIAPRFPGLKLVAIGPDKYRLPLNIHNDRIIRCDYVSDEELAMLYAHAKAFVYVSDREAFGLPPLEALSYGVPSVLADKPISRELFGDNAFFVAHPDSPDSIADSIADALTNDTKRTAILAAAPAILSSFTWPHFASRWLEIVIKIRKE